MISYLPVTVALFAAGATFAGGRFALRTGHDHTWLPGFSAGAVLGVALFDLVPEARDLNPQRAYAAALVGFALYTILYRLLPAYSDSASCEPNAGGASRADAALVSFAMHSLLDGFAIGLAFKVSGAIGAVTSIAVLAHDFVDGVNTVSMALRNTNRPKHVNGWLIIDALAPVVGAASAGFVAVSGHVLGTLLGLFGGFFLYIGACDLLVEGWKQKRSPATIGLAGLGAGAIYVIVHIAGVN